MAKLKDETVDTPAAPNETVEPLPNATTPVASVENGVTYITMK